MAPGFGICLVRSCASLTWTHIWVFRQLLTATQRDWYGTPLFTLPHQDISFILQQDLMPLFLMPGALEGYIAHRLSHAVVDNGISPQQEVMLPNQHVDTNTTWCEMPTDVSQDEDDKDEAELHSDDEEWQGLNDITLNAFASAAASLFTSHRAIGEIGEDRIETDEEHGWWEEESENVVGDESLEPPELEVLVGGQWVMWPNGHISACKLMERG